MKPPRLVPHLPLPPYTFVPGQAPHPVTDPAGHSFGRDKPLPPPLDPARWQDSEAYLHGLDLFNHGFCWEAHEAWEGLWRGFARDDVTALFLQGLIRLAAAGVKVRQGQPGGVRSHARGARRLIERAQEMLPPGTTHYLGLPIAELLTHAAQVEVNPPGAPASRGAVERVLPFVLVPGPESS